MDSYGDRYSFVDTVRLTNGMRKPHVHTGLYITVTRRDDGSLRPKFKPVRMGADYQRGHLSHQRVQRTAPGAQGPRRRRRVRTICFSCFSFS